MNRSKENRDRKRAEATERNANAHAVRMACGHVHGFERGRKGCPSEAKP